MSSRKNISKFDIYIFQETEDFMRQERSLHESIRYMSQNVGNSCSGYSDTTNNELYLKFT